MEIWKEIADYPKYEISNWGNIRIKGGRLLKPFKNKTNPEKRKDYHLAIKLINS